MSGMDMSGMDMSGTAPPPRSLWDATTFALTATMWVVMMVGMMLPSAAPMILLCRVVQRGQSVGSGAWFATLVFALGYLVVWGGFSLLAAAAQIWLSGALLLSPSLALVSPVAGGGLLILAGLYEWSPLKHRCLAQCRGPFGFITAHWRAGRWGALRMGAIHGLYCLGCCWVLMLLLFLGGVMNLLWVAALALFVLVQKVVPTSALVTRAIGGLMVLGGLAVLGRALIAAT